MRLVDADAEILKIEQEIHRIDGKIERTKARAEKEPNNSFHDFEYELKQLLRNKRDCEKEISDLRGYKIACDEDKVVYTMDNTVPGITNKNRNLTQEGRV